MIPEFLIQEWKEKAPWTEPYMVEQDLIICRALISIFSDERTVSSFGRIYVRTETYIRKGEDVYM